MDPQVLVRELGLEPHPEGGFYAETYRAEGTLPAASLPAAYSNERCFSTAIYYLLVAGQVSALHRITSDEIFHFYAGDPVRMLRLFPDGRGDEILIGARIDRGERPQVVVPGGVWQGLELAPGGGFALLGCTVAPGFDFADFELGDAAALADAHPAWANSIHALGRCGMNR